MPVFEVLTYYCDAVIRSALRGWAWAVGQGILLTLVVSLGPLVFGLVRAIWRPEKPNPTAFYLKEFVRSSLAAYFGAALLIFVVSFVLDAPLQVRELEATLKSKSSDEISIDYENSRRWIMPPEDRPTYYKSWAVRVGVTAKRPLLNPRAFTIKIEDLTDNKFVTIEVKAQLAWYESEHSYDLDEITVHDFFVPFLASKDGTKLYLLTNANAQEVQPMRANIPKGDYRLTVVIQGEDQVSACRRSSTW